MMLGPSIVRGCPQQKARIRPNPAMGAKDRPKARPLDIGSRPEKKAATLPASVNATRI